jgi:hypothetical protein
MKKISFLLDMITTFTACSPKSVSEQWCASLKEKPKSDWTATEAKDYTKHCLFK